MSFDHITHRLQFASSSMGLSEAAQAKHLSAIVSALSGVVSDEVRSPSSSEPAIKRRKLVVSLLIAAMLTPAGLAAASDNALPGDALYSVKQITEKVLVLFDHEIVARHRIEELEANGQDSTFDARLAESAEAALSQLSSDHPLWGRFLATRKNSGTSTPSVPAPSRDAEVEGVTPANERASNPVPVDHGGPAALPADDDDSSDEPPEATPQANPPGDDASHTGEAEPSDEDDDSEGSDAGDDSSS